MRTILLVLTGTFMSLVASAQVVDIKTNYGVISLELFADKAPETVANFLRYADEGFYDRTVFHRVIPGFMAQGGGYTTAYEKKDTRDPIRNEAGNGLSNERGTIAMARTGDPHSATAQFFINHVDNRSLDHRGPTASGWGYTVFGRVIDGLVVLDEIAKQPTGPGAGFRSDVPLKPIIIESIRRAESEEEDAAPTSG